MTLHTKVMPNKDHRLTHQLCIRLAAPVVAQLQKIAADSELKVPHLIRRAIKKVYGSPNVTHQQERKPDEQN
jgi:hypothetical protein